LRNGLRIERRGSRVVVHDGESMTEDFIEFFVDEHHCFFVPGHEAQEEWIEALRPRLVHDDLIEAAPGVVFRVRLR
jgi:hypothetical protein